MLLTLRPSTRQDWVAKGRRTTISFYGNLEDAKKSAHHGSMQIDGLEPGDTSPVQHGGSDGMAPLHMEGEKEFTTKRTRHGWVGNQGAKRVEYPEGAKHVGEASTIKK